MSRSRWLAGCVLVVVAGCGDDGRGSDDAGMTSSSPTGTTTAGPTTSTTAPPTGSGSASETQGGSMSATQGMTTSTTGPATTTSESASGTTTMPVETSSGTDATGTSDGTTGDPCGGGMGGVFDFSYLWVANTDQGSISKVNTREAANSGDYAGIRRVA